MASIVERAKQPLSLEYFGSEPVKVLNYSLDLPKEDVYILRMCISRQLDFNRFYLPKEYRFLRGFINECLTWQKYVIGINHPFMYLTIRKGPIKSVTDDEWHVDGFSMRYNHLPEQNYIWCDSYPTEWTSAKPDLKYFDPLKDNIHKRFKKNPMRKTINKNTIYCLDPYVIHRRPSIEGYNIDRTFIRLSFVPIEIKDINNTPNPALPELKGYDGVKDFRNKLI